MLLYISVHHRTFPDISCLGTSNLNVHNETHNLLTSTLPLLLWFISSSLLIVQHLPQNRCVLAHFPEHNLVYQIISFFISKIYSNRNIWPQHIIKSLTTLIVASKNIPSLSMCSYLHSFACDSLSYPFTGVWILLSQLGN